MLDSAEKGGIIVADRPVGRRFHLGGVLSKTVSVKKAAPKECPVVSRILAAAEKLFAKHGFAAASMSAIAKEAGTSKANIYHHFRAKDDLYQAALRFAADGIKTLLEDVADSEATVARKLELFAKAHIEGMHCHADMARLILRELLTDSRKRGREIAESGFADNFSSLTALVRKGQKSGELRKELDPAAVTALVLAANIFFFQNSEVLRHYREVTFADDPERYVKMVSEILLNGITPR